MSGAHAALVRRDRRVAILAAVPARDLKTILRAAFGAAEPRLIGHGAAELRSLALLEWNVVENAVFAWLDGARALSST